MKSSDYNFFVHYEPDNIYIAYNCVSGGLYIFSQDHYNEACDILAGNKDDSYDSPVKNTLLEGRFLISDDTNEIDILKFRNNTTRFNPIDLGLVISPTNFCVFDCPYCYVERERNVMSKETIEGIKKFFLKRIEKANSVQVCWTGGEPLLAIDVVDELTSFFKEKTEAKSILYNSHMVTNGYLLTPQILERLKALGIADLQITLDGCETDHNRFRFTKFGQGTYRRILENVVYASNNGMKIIIRSSISKDNCDGIRQLIDDLDASGLNKKQCVFTPCKVLDTKGAHMPCMFNLLNPREFAEMEPDLLLYAAKKGFEFGGGKLAASRTFCGANTMQSFVIDSYSNVLKCWCNLSNPKNNKVGFINEDGDYLVSDHNTLCKWMGMDSFSNETCLKCGVLPLCFGGCIYYQAMGTKDSFEEGCSLLRFNLEKVLKLLYISKTKPPEELITINYI